MRDGQTNDEQLKMELLSQWKLEAEFRKKILGIGPNPQLLRLEKAEGLKSRGPLGLIFYLES